jgi:hypothetical protein
MEDIRVITDRWAKRFEFFCVEHTMSSSSTQANQEEGQRYVPPPKKPLLPDPPLDQIIPKQTIPFEAQQPPQANKGTQKGEQ